MKISDAVLAQMLDKIIAKVIELEIRSKTGAPYHPDAELVRLRATLRDYFLDTDEDV